MDDEQAAVAKELRSTGGSPLGSRPEVCTVEQAIPLLDRTGDFRDPIRPLCCGEHWLSRPRSRSGKGSDFGGEESEVVKSV